MASLQEVRAIIKSIVIASAGQGTLKRISEDYKDQEGCEVPFRSFGHPTLRSFLTSTAMRADFSYGYNDFGQEILKPKLDAKTAHVQQLVDQQKKASKRPRKRLTAKVGKGGKRPCPIIPGFNNGSYRLMPQYPAVRQPLRPAPVVHQYLGQRPRPIVPPVTTKPADRPVIVAGPQRLQMMIKASAEAAGHTTKPKPLQQQQQRQQGPRVQRQLTPAAPSSGPKPLVTNDTTTTTTNPPLVNGQCRPKSETTARQADGKENQVHQKQDSDQLLVKKKAVDVADGTVMNLMMGTMSSAGVFQKNRIGKGLRRPKFQPSPPLTPDYVSAVLSQLRLQVTDELRIQIPSPPESVSSFDDSLSQVSSPSLNPEAAAFVPMACPVGNQQSLPSIPTLRRPRITPVRL